MRAAVGTTEEIDAEAAAGAIIEQCRAGLDGETPRAGLLLASHDLEVEDFLGLIHETWPDLRLVGCTTIATMSSGSGYGEAATTLTLFASDEVDCTTGVGTGLRSDVIAAARAAVDQARSATDKDPVLCVITPTVEHIDPVEITNALSEVLPAGVVVFGGGANPDLPMSVPWEGGLEIYGREVMSDALPILLFSGPLALSIGVAHGWKPVGREAVVTRASGNIVHELDGMPTEEFYRRYLGDQLGSAIAYPLMIPDQNGKHYLRAPMKFLEDGSASCLGSVPEGVTVHLAMASPEDILDGASAAAGAALEKFPAGATPSGALVSCCATRAMLLGSRSNVEVERIRAALGDLPVSGFYAYGEVAPLEVETPARFHNETCATLLFGK